MTRAADYPFPRVLIECPKCGRKGSYARERFAGLVGPEAQLPDALARIDTQDDHPRERNEEDFIEILASANREEREAVLKRFGFW